MPTVTALPRLMQNGESVTYFTDTIGTFATTFRYNVPQNGMAITNGGSANIIVTTGNAHRIIEPGKTRTINSPTSTFSIKSESGLQQFECRSWTNDSQRLRIPLVRPSGYTWNAPINMYTDGFGNYSTDFDVSTFAVPGAGKEYWVTLSGLDTNDGLTEQTALRSLKAGANKADMDILTVEPGVYTRNFGLDGVDAKNRNFIIRPSRPGRIVISGFDTFTWTKTANRTATYQVSRTSIYNVYDGKFRDQFDDMQLLTKQNSIAAVDANPGSYYTDGTLVYVRTSDSRQPDANVKVNIAVTTADIANAGKIYMENVDFEGGRGLTVTGSTTVASGIYCRNVTAKYSMARDGGFSVLGVNEAFFQDCTAARVENDGFNYHTSNAIKVYAIEVNCTGRHNGSEGNNDNGSTMHDGGSIIRLNGRYFENVGPNAADVNAGTLSWNIGCTMRDSRATNNAQNSGIHVADGTGGEVKTWIEGCVCKGSRASIVVRDSGKAYIRNFDVDTGDLTGTVELY